MNVDIYVVGIDVHVCTGMPLYTVNGISPERRFAAEETICWPPMICSTASLGELLRKKARRLVVYPVRVPFKPDSEMFLIESLVKVPPAAVNKALVSICIAECRSIPEIGSLALNAGSKK